MKKILMCFAATALAFAVGSANAADKKTLAVVVKGLDNGFFTVLGNGCAKWNDEHPDSEYKCVYTGPALTSDEAGELQIVADLIARDDVAGIAISPSNAPAMGKLLKDSAAQIKAKKIAIMTVDAPLMPEDAALRSTYFGSSNYNMGVTFCQELQKLRPKGGKVALMFGNPSAENLNQRGYGFRDCIKGKILDVSTTQGRDLLKGEGGWTEVQPTNTNDDIPLANQQYADVLAANPDLNAYVLLGGWAEQGCEAFNATSKQYEARYKSGDYVVVAGDMVGCQDKTIRAGFSQVNIAQKPLEMGLRSPDILIDIINGKKVEDPQYTGFDRCTIENVDTCISK